MGWDVLVGSLLVLGVRGQGPFCTVKALLHLQPEHFYMLILYVITPRKILFGCKCFAIKSSLESIIE